MEEKEEEEYENIEVLDGYLAHDEAPDGCPTCKTMLIMFILGYIVGLWTSPYVLPFLKLMFFV
jgi:hypothetical protein